MRRGKKITAWIAGIMLTPVLLVALLVLAFYLPPVQQWAVRKVSAYASEQTGLDVKLERLRIRFPLDLELANLCVTTPPDTIVAVRSAIVDLNFSNILDWRLGVDAVELCDGVVDTRDLIATVVVKGGLGTLRLTANEILLKNQRVELTSARLDGCDVDIQLRDTTVVDTTESGPILWTIGLGDISLLDTRVVFHTADDSLMVRGGVRELTVKGGDVNLTDGIYRVDKLILDADSLLCNEMSLRQIRLEGKDVLVDNTHMQALDFHLTTPNSYINGRVNLEWDALTPRRRGHMDADLDASIGHADIVAVAGPYLSKEILGVIPEAPPVTLKARMRGNVDSLSVDECRLAARPVAEAELTGSVTNVLNVDSLGADANVNVVTRDLSRVRRFLGLAPTIQLPSMQIKGDAHIHNQMYSGDLRLWQGRGRGHVRGRFDARREVYQADVDIRDLNLHNFLPKDSIYELTAHAKVSGHGLDLLSRRSVAKAEVNVDHLRYGHYNLNNLRLTGDASNGVANVNLMSDNELLAADACATLQLDNGIEAADFTLGATHIDLHALGLVDRPTRVSMQMAANGNSNLRDSHELKGKIEAIELAFEDTVFYPTDIEVALLLRPDTLQVEANSGDLALQLFSSEPLNDLFDRSTLLVKELERQFGKHHLAQDTLKSLLPLASLRVNSGPDNTLAHIIRSLGYQYGRMKIELDSNPLVGLNGNGYVHALNTGAIQLDTIQFRIHQDTADVVRFNGRVRNGPRNKQVVFESNLLAELTPTGANAAVTFLDAKRCKGVDVGASLFLEDDGYRLHLNPLNPIIAYRRFTLNESNFIVLHDDRRVEADVDLLADDGTGFKLYTTPNDEALQDVTLSVHDFNLGELSAVIPYFPQIGGTLAGDFHLVQDEKSVSVLVDAAVQKMSYEEAALGNVGLNALYLPNADGTHYVDGIMSLNGYEVATLAGTYNPKGDGTIDAEAALMRLPLSLANGFIPNKTLELDGYFTGNMSVKGKVSNPVLDGALVTDSMHLNSDMYSLHLRFPDDTIGVRNSFLDFNRIEAYSSGKNPLVLDGNINFRDFDRIRLALSLSAKNFELINAPKAHHAVAYGKVYVDLGARLTGSLDDMIMRGKLDVLGNTNVTYVLTDSPLTADDQLSELVTFADFSDTLVVETERKSPQNIDVLMDITIEQAAQAHCLLSADGTNHIDLEGGGDLSMSYSTQDGLNLYGRYTIVSGVLNYNLMVMSLKNFQIDSGSYVEFMGEVANPRLSISAKERVKTTVYENDVPRSVNFDVGVNVTQSLENMGLEFTIDAPSDITIYNQLASMSAEERGKVAVTMLATGMYLTESGNGTTGFSATNALNSFLQSQISALYNRALSTIDVNFSVDNTESASGGTQTDYSFSFAKRFWNNRISLIIGGKVSSGGDAANTGQSIINNVSVEYRLDKSATRYVRLYYDRDTESLLEGEVMEMGAGVVFRRKSNRLGELFIFKKK